MDGGVGASFVFCSGDLIRPDGPLGSIIEETVFFFMIPNYFLFWLLGTRLESQRFRVSVG